MRFDPHLNWRRSTVAGAPSPATSGTALTLATGEGTLFPATSAGSNSYNLLVWPASVLPTRTNAELIRVVTRATDVLSVVTRAQEGSTAQSIAVGWQVALVPSAKTFEDIELAALGGNALTPTTLSADQNNWAPTSWSERYNIIRAESTGAARTITGLTGGVDGRVVTIENVGASLDLSLSYESGSSTAANRMIWGSGLTLTLRPNQSATFIYDGTSSRWRLQSVTETITAWTAASYANGVVTSESGSLTTCTAAMRYQQIGKRLYFSIAITITTKGTGAGRLIFPCPNSLTPQADSIVAGHVLDTTQKAVTARSSGASFYTSLYDGSTPILTNGNVVYLEGVVEVS